MTEQTVSDAVGAKIRRLREHLGEHHTDKPGITLARLAQVCAENGDTHLTESVLGDIETGRLRPDGTRRREITVDELVSIAQIFGVPPASLLPPVAIQPRLLSPDYSDPGQLAAELETIALVLRSSRAPGPDES